MKKFYPIVGRKDNYKFLEPFTKKDINESLTVVKVGKLYDYVNSEIDILRTVYEPVGLTKEDLEADLAIDADLVTLTNNKKSVIIPSTYLTVQNVVSRTHAYNRRVLVVDLGDIGSEEDLIELSNELRLTTIAMLGKTPNIKEVIVTSDVYVTDSEHQLKQNDRAITKNGVLNTKAQIELLEKTLASKREEIEDLKCIIKTLPSTVL